MTERPLYPDIHIMDPMFPIPDGMRGMEYAENDGFEAEEEYDTEDLALFNDNYLIDESETETSFYPDVPNSLTVISETIRTASTGNQVIDVLVEVEDVPGVVEYEFRITKL